MPSLLLLPFLRQLVLPFPQPGPEIKFKIDEMVVHVVVPPDQPG
jgi:hypothetical protein